jgi:hypothetical protein
MAEYKFLSLEPEVCVEIFKQIWRQSNVDSGHPDETEAESEDQPQEAMKRDGGK